MALKKILGLRCLVKRAPDVLRLVNIGQKYQKGEYYLNGHLHINMNSHFHSQENPSSGLGGVAITSFF